MSLDTLSSFNREASISSLTNIPFFIRVFIEEREQPLATSSVFNEYSSARYTTVSFLGIYCFLSSSSVTTISFDIREETFDIS